MQKNYWFLLTFIIFLLILISISCVIKFQGTELRFLIRGKPAELKLWQNAIDLFMQENKGIKVKIEYVPYNQYWSKIETMLAGDMAPDVIFLESTRAASFIKLNALLSLDDFILNDRDFNKEDFYQQAIDAYTYQGKLYGLPNDLAIYAVYYNIDLFKKTGTDFPTDSWTWTDFLKACKKLTLDENQDGVPEHYGFNVGWTYYLWIWQNGGDFYNNPSNPGRAVLNSLKTRQALQFLKNLMYKYKVAPTFAQAASFGSSSEMFMTGKVAMIIEGHWMVPQFRDITSFAWDVAALPSAQRNKGQANFNAGSCFSIPKLSKNKQQAWKLIKFLSGTRAQKLLLQGGFSTPALKTREITDFFLESVPPKNNEVFLKMIQYAHLPPIMHRYNEMNDCLYTELDNFWLNKKSLIQILSGLQKKLNEFITEE